MFIHIYILSMLCRLVSKCYQDVSKCIHLLFDLLLLKKGMSKNNIFLSFSCVAS